MSEHNENKGSCCSDQSCSFDSKPTLANPAFKKSLNLMSAEPVQVAKREVISGGGANCHIKQYAIAQI